MEALRKNMQFEIDRLTAALADAEARMKVCLAYLPSNEFFFQSDSLAILQIIFYMIRKLWGLLTPSKTWNAKSTGCFKQKILGGGRSPKEEVPGRNRRTWNDRG